MSAAILTSRVLACLLPCLAAGCASSVKEFAGGPGDQPTRLQISSPGFVAQQAIPAEHTCEGDDMAPALRWSQVPADARSLVLIVDDADAGRALTHWVVYNLPPSAGELAAGVTAAGLPRGAIAGHNDWQSAEYRGPCPESGEHQYHFKFHALDTLLGGGEAATRQQIEAAMQGHVLATGELVGTYQRTGMPQWRGPRRRG